MRVAVFTDNDFDKVNGVTTTWRAVLDVARASRGVRMFTASDADVDLPDYYAAGSFGAGLPWYRDMRVFWPSVTRFDRELRRHRTTVIHVATPGPVGLVGRYLAGRHGLPLVGSYHTQLGDYVRVFSGSRMLGSALDRYMRWFYRPCASLLAPSESTAGDLARRGYPAERLGVWPRGVDCDRFSPARRSETLRRAWRVDERRPAIIYAGRLSAEKGLRAAGAFQRALHRHAVDHRFIFVGDGPLRSELGTLMPDAVFTGTLSHDEVAAAMASADLFYFPSATDTFGNVVLEAQASGLPVLVSDRGGPCQQMRPGVTGEVCTADDVGAFAQAAVGLLRDPRRRAACTAAARDYALGRSWEAAVQPLFAAWGDADAVWCASHAATGAVLSSAPTVTRRAS